MLSPSSIPSEGTSRVSSNRSIDSGYGSCIREDANLDSVVSVVDPDISAGALADQPGRHT